MSKFFFISIIDRNIHSIIDFCKEVEKFDVNEVTGINFVSLRDKTYYLSVVVSEKVVFDELWNKALKYSFLRINDKEEQYIELLPLSNVAILGNFSSALFEKMRGTL